MTLTNKQIDRLIASKEPVVILNDSGARVSVQFIARDRSYIEFVDLTTGYSGKMHKDDFKLA